MERHATMRDLSVAISEDTPTDQITQWSMERFADQRIIITSSFGMEGCAVIDMYAKVGVPITVVYLDTMFFFPETYALRDQLMARYPHLIFENRGTDLRPEQQADKYGPDLWKTDPDLCCKIRKVDPMYKVMADVDVWLTGLRRSQSVARANLQVIEWDWRYQVLKISPIAKWEREDVWAYIQKNDVPYNELHERGYPTVGCTHCTQAVKGIQIGQYSREGRWSDIDKTECGLHGGEGI